MSSAPNPNHLSPRWGSTTKAFVAGVVLILGALAIWRFNFLIRPLAMSLILAYLLNPIIVWMQTRTRLHRTYVVLLVYMALLLIWSAAFIAMGFIVADQAIKLRDVLPDLLPRLIVAVRDISTNWSKTAITVGTYRFTLRGLQTVVDWNALAQQARMGIQPVVSRGGRFIAALAQATLDTLAIGLLVFVVSIYMSKDLPKFGRFLSDVARQPGYAHDVERLLHETVAIWNAYLRGQIILSLVIGLIAGISLSILGVNYPLALGVLAGLLEFLHDYWAGHCDHCRRSRCTFSTKQSLVFVAGLVRIDRVGRHVPDSATGRHLVVASHYGGCAGFAPHCGDGYGAYGRFVGRSFGCDPGCSGCRYRQALQHIHLAQDAGFAAVSGARRDRSDTSTERRARVWVRVARWVGTVRNARQQS